MTLVMLLKLTLLVKSLATYITCEAVLSSMNRMVIISILCLGEGFRTIFTLILNSLMFIHMNLVAIAAIVSFATLLTIKTKLSSVELLVSLKTKGVLDFLNFVTIHARLD